MVNSRTYIIPGRQVSSLKWLRSCAYLRRQLQTTNKQVVSRYYGADEPKSRPLTLIARCNQTRDYPLIESVLKDLVIQPYVHNCSVRVLHKNRISTYLLFYRLHRHLPVNRAVSLVSRSSSVRGDVVVMRTNDDGRVVGMRHGDAVIADEIVKE